ncbi:hypothetical protein [Microseira sp. BLCC-F43]|uniref:hypothetical protein n=1 Tax=Microseira sp. BLCC-F43 TaxID=3153602 RepID=UPI0035BA97A1
MTPCPCCSYPMLRHARPQQIYWYCNHCRQEMPNLSAREEILFQKDKLEKLINRSPLVVART